MASSAGKRGAGLASGFLDKPQPKSKQEQPPAALSLEEVVKRLRDLEATVTKQAGEIYTLKKLLNEKDKLSDQERAQARQAQDKLARDSAALAADVKKQADRMAQVEKAQELHARSALACTVIVHAYAGDEQPSADSVKAKLMQPCGLPCSEVLSCVQLGSARREEAAGGSSEGAAVGDAAGASGAGEGRAAPVAASRPVPSTPQPKRCVTFKVVLASAEAAMRLLVTKAKHRSLGTGLVIRQALTRSERAVQQAFMPLYCNLKQAGTAVDFRRGRLFKRVEGKWTAVPPPRGVQEL